MIDFAEHCLLLLRLRFLLIWQRNKPTVHIADKKAVDSVHSETDYDRSQFSRSTSLIDTDEQMEF